MKSKSYKFLAPVFMVISFAFMLLLNCGLKVSAANQLDFYYPNTQLAEAYNADGSVSLKNTLVVYMHNNGAGYVLDGDKVRIGSVSIINGSEEETISSGISYSSVSDYNSLDREVYGDLPSSKLQAVEIPLSGSLTMDLEDINNTITIKINLQQRKYVFGVKNGWKSYSYSDVYSFLGGVRQDSNSVKMVATNTAFANSQLNIDDLSLSVDKYSIADFEAKKAATLTVATNFKFTGYVNAYYTNDKYVSIHFSNNNQASINLYGTSVIASEKDGIVTFSKFTVNNAKDVYQVPITQINCSKSVQFDLDTVKPAISSAGVSNNVETFHDIGEITATFNFSESLTFNLTKVYFKIGNTLLTNTCSENCEASTTNELLSITRSYYLYGNGAVTLVGFEATLTDTVGNVNSYTYETSTAVCTANKAVSIVSSLVDVTTDYAYYYENDEIVIKVKLSSASVNIDDFTKISIDIFNNKTYVMTTYEFSSKGKLDDLMTLSYLAGSENSTIKAISFHKNGSEDPIFVKELNINLNTYLSLNLKNKTITNPSGSLIRIYSSSQIKTFNTSKVVLMPVNSAIGGLNCKIQSNAASCSYTSTKDGSDKIKLERGAVILKSGIRNDEEVFTLISNTRAPVVETVLNNQSVVMYDSINYYKNGTYIITFNLSDGYSDNSCLYYKINNVEHSPICTNQVRISLPEAGGEYVIKYHTSDGVNTSSETTMPNKFKYRGSFELDDISVSVNDIEVDESMGNIDSTKKYNKIKVSYENAKALDLLKTFNVIIHSKKIVNITSNVASNTFNVVASELGNVDDAVKIEIFLIDMLNNLYSYDVYVNIDTIAPSFDTILAQTERNDDKYEVSISGYDEYEIKVKVDGIDVDLVNSKFVTETEKYEIILKDSAGNEAEKVFTTVPPSVELNVLSTSTYTIKYEIYISPFDSSIHTIEDYRYLVFDYLSDVTSNKLDIARHNVCTAGRKVNCYINGSYDSKVGLINQTFDRGYTYILDIKINNVLASDITSGNLPRIDILQADAVSPVGNFLGEDLNPDFVSSTSGKEFKFSFLATDTNLSSSYQYLIVDASLTSLNVTRFYEMYKSCYGAVSSANKCAIRGENQYLSEYEEDTYLGELIFKADSNTRRRMVDNKDYVLYVLLLDDNNNSAVFKIREFKNIMKAATIQYLNDDSVYEDIENGEEVVTINSSTIKINTYNDVELKSVSIDNVVKVCNNNTGCQYSLDIGKREIKVEDVLGNISLVTVYSATANKPVIEVYYQYDSQTHFKILDNRFAYNTSNAGKVYIKVKSNDLQMVKVTMNSTSNYSSGSTIFDSLIDDSNVYGMKLLSIMEEHNGSLYSGDVTIRAVNSDGGESSITLVVDNENPIINLDVVPSENAVNLLGTYYDLGYEDNKYVLEFDYQRDITYQYMMDALLLRVDGMTFDEVKDNNRFKFLVNSNNVSYYDSISKGNKTIVIDYFDGAGNSAQTLTILLTCKDDVNPTITLNNELSIVELNSSVSLADVIIEDNHDDIEDLELIVKIGETVIDYDNYKFSIAGEYVIVYEVRDTSNNVYSVSQTLLVKDTTGPTLKAGIQKNYTLGIGKDLVIDMPVFEDKDKSGSQYLPYQIKVLDKQGSVMNEASSTYPLVVDNDKLAFRFNASFELGDYEVLFVVKDDHNNATEEVFVITLVDDEAPIIEVSVNNRVIGDGETINFPLGSNLVIGVDAIDSYTGGVQSSIVRKITFNGKKVNEITSSKNGTYILEVSASDSYSNIAKHTITIVVDKDEVDPVINKVLVNGIELSKTEVTKINSITLSIVVEASDDFGDVISDIVINDTYTIENGGSLSIGNDISSLMYTLIVKAKDLSGNETSATYTIIVDNKKPVIAGVIPNYIYNGQVSLTVSDENIESIKIYKNGELDQTLSSNVYSFKISLPGLYGVVARDTYGNVIDAAFAIMDKNSYSINDGNGNIKDYSFKYTTLVEVEIISNAITLKLQNDSLINNNDRIYVLVNFPNTNSKYIAYSMDGTTYLSNAKISITDSIIDGYNNIDLLEKIDDKYYAYVMVIGDAVDDKDEGKTEKETNESIVSAIVLTLVIVSIIALVFVIMKWRRKIRAA